MWFYCFHTINCYSSVSHLFYVPVVSPIITAIYSLVAFILLYHPFHFSTSILPFALFHIWCGHTFTFTFSYHSRSLAISSANSFLLLSHNLVIRLVVLPFYFTCFLLSVLLLVHLHFILFISIYLSNFISYPPFIATSFTSLFTKLYALFLYVSSSVVLFSGNSFSSACFTDGVLHVLPFAPFLSFWFPFRYLVHLVPSFTMISVAFLHASTSI